MRPLVERLGTEYAGKVDFKVYTDSGDPVGDALAAKFNIQYVPTFIFINKDGSVSGQPIIGETNESTLRARIDALK